MRRMFVHPTGFVMALVLLITWGAQSISRVPLAQERPAASVGAWGSGRTIVVSSAADSGPGSLRQAILDAQRGDIITFDPAVFPPTALVTISLSSSLPAIRQDYLTIDGSNAGVVLDGANLQANWHAGLEIQGSKWNVIRGLRFQDFLPGAGIVLSGGAQHNTIGGDRSIGSGPLGQGNQVIRSGLGIGLWGQNTSFNTVTGNVLGTGPSGTVALGNNGGIGVSEGGSHNILGPDNIIAFNRENGIGVLHPDSIGNTILHNSIHDNNWWGINLSQGGNAELAAPLIFDFDLYNGTIVGTTCPDCIVEVFSDGGDEGEIYEGQIAADSLGAFVFDKETGLTGPHLTATATDASGNTSEFSVPTSGARRSARLQEGNNLPRTRLWPKRSPELADNRIGSMCNAPWCTLDERTVADFAALGVKWMRLSLNELDCDRVDWGRSEFYIDPSEDHWITEIVSSGITISYNLIFWDKANHPGGWESTESRFKTEEDIQRYLDYVRFIVRHFKDRIQYFQVWNEPDLPCPAQRIEVSDYVNLVRRLVPVIHEEHPEAKIEVGDVSGVSNPERREYLLSILRSDVMPLVDIVTWHPMYGAAPDCPNDWGYYYAYPAIVQEIKNVASANGFIGQYSGTELQYRNPENPNPYEPCTHSKVVCAKYYIRGIVMHLGMDVSTGVIGTFTDPAFSASLWPVRNLCTSMADTRAITMPVELQIEATNVMTHGFSLPNGDRMFALWINGVAVDDDTGITSTLMLPGFAGYKAVGIDILNGFEQQLIASDEDGNLVIHNLLVKDYPIILRLALTRYVFMPIVLKGYTH